MKIIDLINMRAEGKEMPKKIRINHWCYNFDWIEHESNYYDRNAEIDLMSCLSLDKEELNYKVEIIEEDKKIEKLNSLNTDYYAKEVYYERLSKEEIALDIQTLKHWINKIIDYLMKEKK